MIFATVIGGCKCQKNDGDSDFWLKFWFERTQIYLNTRLGKNMYFLLDFNQNKTTSVYKPHAQKNVY